MRLKISLLSRAASADASFARRSSISSSQRPVMRSRDSSSPARMPLLDARGANGCPSSWATVSAFSRRWSVSKSTTFDSSVITRISRELTAAGGTEEFGDRWLGTESRRARRLASGSRLLRVGTRSSGVDEAAIA
jgi:hypothetical protein